MAAYSDHSHDDSYDSNGHEHDEHSHAGAGFVAGVKEFFQPHSHDHRAKVMDSAIATDRGIWAMKVSLIALMATAALQMVIVMISQSVALLADTVHNFSDALTAIPLWVAFALARRDRNQRYTYGYGRAEDLAGALITLMILASAVEVFYESGKRILHPQPIRNLGWVVGASVIGFVGNELVAVFRIKIGREIGSAALIADGLHSRVDGLTSLGVLVGAAGVWLGFPLADPIIGFTIGFTILFIVWGTAKDMWFRLMDAVDPQVSTLIAQTASDVAGVLGVHDVRARWSGHRQLAELHIVVDCRQPTLESHRIAENVRHEIFHTLPALLDVTVHIDPCECDPKEQYHHTDHHLEKS